MYIGYQNASGGWYIKRQDTTTTVWTYAKGTSGFSTAWTNKASQTYNDWDNNNVALASLVTASQTIIVDSDGDEAQVIAGAQTGVKGLRVYGGPTDPISDIPVGIDFEHHQVHEGESYVASLEQLSIGTGTVKFSIDVPVDTYPHMIISVDTYDGACLVRKYHTATYTGGSAMTAVNRNRNSANAAATTIKSGITSTNGTLFESFFAGSAKTTGGNGRSMSEIILKANSTYRFDVVGQSANTKAVINFFWYEDLGV
jgi:hypothetical protein